MVVDRGQSETLDTLALIAVVATLSIVVGIGALAGLDTTTAPLLEVELEATDTNIEISHEGGDRINATQLRVIFRGDDGETRFGMEDAIISGDGDLWFEVGESLTHAHGLSDSSIRVVIIHEPTNSVLVDRTVDITTPQGVAGASNNIPTAAFTYDPSNPAAGQEITFDASSSSDSDGTITKYEWDWTNDGTYDDTGKTATHTYDNTGDHTVKLRVTDDHGATDTTTVTISLTNIAPTALFTYSPPTPGVDQTITFDASASTDLDGTITSYEWDWTSDGTYEDTGVTATHSYSSAGAYTVTLRVTDDTGLTDTTTEVVTVNLNTAPSPDFSYSPSNPSTGQTIDFDGSASSDPDGTIVTYEWDWANDGTYDATGETPSHSYSSADTYTVKLKTTDNLGAWNTTTKTVTVTANSLPSAAFSATVNDWYSSAWSYRKQLEIDHRNVAADHANFPVLIDVTDADLKSDARSDAHDVLFTAGNGTTKLDHEIEAYDDSAGHLVAWVKVPQLNGSAPNTTIYMYYGDADAPNQENVTGVWNSDYEMVQHLEESNGDAEDSTANENDGTVNGPDQGSSGVIDTAYEFKDNQNDDVTVPDDASLDITDTVTISAWIYPDSIDDWNRIVAKSHHANHWPYTHYGLLFDDEDHLRMEVASCETELSTCQQEVDGSTTVPTDQWTYATVTYDGIEMVVYNNGNEDGSTTVTTTIPTNDMPLTIGKSGFDADYFDGRIDEVRVSSIARSADWVSTQYNTTNDPSGFYSVGSEESAYPVDVNASGSSDPDGSISTYDWDWTDDGNYDDSGETVTHSYASPGAYTIRLRVTDDDGSTDTTTKQVSLSAGNADPTAAFSASPGSPDTDESVAFNGSDSVDPDDSISTYEWDWTNDGTFEDTGKTATHEYETEGTYTVKLRVTDDGGRTDTTTKTINVSPTTFVEETSTANLGSSPGGGAIVFSDFDGDSYLDVFMNDNDYTSDEVRLRENEGDLTFKKQDNKVAVEGGRGAGTGDYDNDGDPDLIVGVGQKLNENKGSFVFEDATAGSENNEEALMFVDIDGDGDLDIWSFGEDYMWHENTDSGWTSHTTLPGTTDDETANGEGATAADINDDGYVDLMFAQSGSDVDAWLNDGDYTYTETDVGDDLNLPEDVGNHENMEWAWGDYDSDGDMDVYISGDDNEGLYRNDGTGSFTDVTSSAGISESNPDGAAWGDYDNDGDLDLILADADGNSDLYNNDGDGTFTDVDSSANLDADGALGSTVGWFDADNDGDLDIVTNDPAKLWNNTRDDGEYLRVIVRGNTSPKTPIGAQVEVYENDTGTMVGHRELIASQNQLQPPLRQHFGVDPSASYDVKVRFPSGEVAWRNATVPNEENVTVGGNTLENTVRIYEPDVVTFVEETTGSNLGSSPGGGAIVLADFDEDGYLDVFMNDNDYDSDVVRLRENDGDFTFTEHDSAVSRDGGRGAGTGDYDNDGDSDLIVGVGQKLNDNQGNFNFDGSTVSGSNNNNEEALMFADIDGDGDLDIWSPGEDYLWHENTESGWTSHDSMPGDGTDRTANGEGATAADINNDGYIDFLWSQDGDDVDVFLNDGDYTYTHHGDVDSDFGLPENVEDHEDMDWAWGDYDSDGDMDVFISGNNNEGLYENDGSGSFTEVSSSAGVTASDPDGAAWGDYDNDGDLDLVVIEHQEISNLYRNEGDGTFAPRGSPAGVGGTDDLGSPTGWFDADTDGDLDLVSNEPERLWNNTLDDGRYLRVMVQGNASSGGSPRTPIGAQVEVYENESGTLAGHRELIASQNQLQPPLRQHFGVDPSSSYDVRVRFPSGAVVWQNDSVPEREFVAVGSTTLNNTVRIEEPAPGWPMKQYDAQNAGEAGGAAPRSDLVTAWTYNAPTDGFDASGPVVSEDTIYVGDKDKDNPTLHAIWTNGTQRWVYIGATDEFKSTAAIDDQRVYAAAKDGVIHAVDLGDGTASWTYSTGDDIDKSSVTVDDGVVYVADKSGTIYAIFADTGVEMWSKDVGEEIKSAPAISNETVYVGAKKSGKLYALDAIDGSQQWTFSTGEEIELAAPTVAGDTVYVGEKKEGWFYAIHAANGTERWSKDLGEEIKSSPAVHEGTVYVSEKKNASGQGMVYALDAADNSEEWSYTTEDELEDAAPAVVNGSVYVGDKGGYVYILDAATGSEVWKSQVGEEIKAPLAVTDDAIYIADHKDEAVYAIQPSTLFADDFDRADSDSLDEGWSETETESDDARVQSDRLDFEPDNNGERPAIEHSFDEQASGKIRLNFTFNFERTGSESWYSANIQLGDGDSMVDPQSDHDQGVAVNLKWGGDAGSGVSDMDDDEGFGYTENASDTQIGVVSGADGFNSGGDASVSVTVDLDANTYDITVTGAGLVSGSGTATDVRFDNNVDIDTVRVFLDEVADGNFGNLEIDDIEIDRIS